MPSSADTANARPTKGFFIDMLTRDISLAACVLDLVDNSLHSLIREFDMDVMQTLLGIPPKKARRAPRIAISLGAGSFTIEDTCGGISVKDAQTAVFRLGFINPTARRAGLGFYGIGMKRACFKIGRSISVISRTKEEGFEVPIDVDVWEKTPDWEFPLNIVSPQDIGGTPGTAVHITRLRQGVGKKFASSSFVNELRDRIGKTYALFIKNGVEILVNDVPIKSLIPEVAQSQQITPARSRITEDGVEILIIAGVTDRSDRIPRGWYVFCNGRLVLESEKTRATGWGTDTLPAWHSKFNHFIGYVFFKSRHVDKLPWTTTKADVDQESPVYQAALREMRLQARPILNFLNRLYPDDIEARGVSERETLQTAKGTTVDMLMRRDTPFKATPCTSVPPDEVSVNLRRKREDIDRIVRRLGKRGLSAKAAVNYCIDYFLRTECE